MTVTRNNYAFKGHKTLLGAKFVTYGELELPLRYDLYAQSKNDFDWGHTNSGSKQLAFSMLCQLSNEDFAKDNVLKFTNEIILGLTSRDWIITASDVLKWIEKNSEKIEIDNKDKREKEEPSNILILKSPRPAKKSKQKTNVVKEVCNELQITQKHLAHILEIPEGTVSSWAVKNEIPRLGKKAIEFYIQSQKNQEIVDSYKSFVKLLNVS